MNALKCYDTAIAIDGLSLGQCQQLASLTGFACEALDSDRDTEIKLSFSSKNDGFNLKSDDGSPLDEQSFPLYAQVIKRRAMLRLVQEHPQLFFLSGEAVRLPNSAVVAIIGPSFSGKSTLAKAFMAQGAALYSKDALAVNNQGQLLAYPVTELPLQGLQPAAILFAGYQPKASWQPTALSAGQAAIQTLAHMVRVRADDQMGLAMAALDKFCASAGLIAQGEYGSLESVLQYVLPQLG